ncbi:acyltransferase family protein [Cyanobium sp. ATX 6F1]|uniref:acyltransferase family protein n=1 Tax=Cyanobium sp. ATX 6F1 TaxID=2823702 RepID=UPI0020CE5A77|nr:acyltransferase [Cyanobium sp. ATX 6F1]MCP9915834.1 acyltransferase [Cyanobium sp. ATX 6F1]
MSTSGRIHSLEVLRCVAALAVAWFHITHGGKLLAGAASPLLQAASALGAIGFHGITLFFVLTGFVIPWSIRNAPPVDGLLGSLRDLPSFLMRRLLRLQPPYAVASVLALGLNCLSTLAPGYQGSFSVTVPQAFTALLSDNLYLTGLLGGSWILVVAWTLALEVQFYAVAGLIEPWARPAQREALSPWLYALGVAAVSALAVLIPQNTLVFRVLPVFALGWVTAHQAMRPRPLHWLAMAWLLLLLARLAGIEQALVAAVCVALLHLALAAPAFGPAPLLWFGGISYSLFLTHVPIGGRVVNLLSRWPLSPLSQLLVCLLALVLSVLVAWGFWALIERPSHRFSRRPQLQA